MKWRPPDRSAAFDTPLADESRPVEHDARSMQRTGDSTGEHALQFHQLAGILRRRIRLILAIAAVGTMLAAAVGLAIPPKYTATAQLAVDPQRGTAPADEAMAIDTHVAQVDSRNHLRRVAESMSRDPEFRAPVLEAGEPEVAATEGVGGWMNELKRRLSSWGSAESGGGWMNELKRRLSIWTGAFRRSEEETVAGLEELERGTRVNQERRSRVISVAFTSANRVRAAASANRIVELYVDNQIEQKRAHASVEMARLDERIAELKHEMESAGKAAQQSIQRLGAVGSSTSEGREAEGQLRELERHAAASAQLYGNLLRRQKEMRDHQEIVAPGVRVLSLAAAPDRPSSHNPLLFILPALIVFAIGGSLLAVVLEQLDRGLRSERDINDALGISCIGLVPRVRRARRTPPHRHMLKEPFSPYAEAIRSAVVALRLAPAARASSVVLISSSVPREGKTMLAVSLAAYAALVGRRVLLIDLDFRRSSILPAPDGHAEKGLADVLLHDCPPEEAIRRIPELALDYLPVTYPVELLASEGMPELLSRLRKSYDCVLIDGPPLLGAAEARLLAPLADKVLFVVKWGRTRRELAQNALNLLRSACGSGKRYDDLSVAVVTQVDLKKHARYRYGDFGETLMRYGGNHRSSTGAVTRLIVDKHSRKVARQQPAQAEGVKR